MDFTNCVRCGKLFNRGTIPICESCVKREEEDFLRIKDFIYENPNSSMSKVAEGTGVSLKRILKYLKEGRLELSPDVIGNDFTCERCDAPITTGKYCKKCQAEFSSEVNELFRKDEPELKKSSSSQPNNKMHYGKREK